MIQMQKQRYKVTGTVEFMVNAESKDDAVMYLSSLIEVSNRHATRPGEDIKLLPGATAEKLPF